MVDFAQPMGNSVRTENDITAGNARGGTIVGFGRRQRDRALVYEHIKRRLLQYKYPPGKPIEVKVIAADLHVRPGPVRKACQQLVGEGWAIGGDRHHVLAWHPDENNQLRLYESTQELLIAALTLAKAAEPAANRQRAAAQRAYESLSRHPLSDEDVANVTAELFLAIVEAVGNEHAAGLMATNNESLPYLRMLENHYLESVASDVARICELMLASRFTEVMQRIRVYHRERCDWLPRLLLLVAKH